MVKELKITRNRIKNIAIVVFILVTIVVGGCGSETGTKSEPGTPYETELETKEEALYYDEGTQWYQGEVKDGLPHGKGTEYHFDGTIWYQGEVERRRPARAGNLLL